MQETRVQSLGWEDPLEKEMAPHFSTLAWKIPWTEEPGRLQSTGSQRVGHNWVMTHTKTGKSLSLSILTPPLKQCTSETSTQCPKYFEVFLFSFGEGNGNPLQYSCLENPMDWGAWGRLQSMGLWRVGHDWVTSLSLSCIGEGNGNPLQCSCLENPRDGGAWWAAVHGVTQSWTRLKWLSSSSSHSH